MSPYEIIMKKRDGLSLSYEEINFFISSYTNGIIPDYQMSALAMAIYFQGMTSFETANLTKVMLESGVQIDLSSTEGIKVDKHSTGGVGDKISIPLIATVMSAGVIVPMIAGRGLGHTGGTIDKLESIPGFNVDLSESKFIEFLSTSGGCLIGQTENIAPADKKLYALRDVTATVPSIPLITASIMSKKLAEGADAFTLDIKYGNGAFMKDLKSARTLAKSLVDTGIHHKRKMIAFLTNMDQPLGYKIGNWLEIEESIDILKGKGPKDVLDLTLLFAGSMIYQAEKAKTIEEGISIAKTKIRSGEAYHKFCELVQNQGGDTSVFDVTSGYGSVKEEVLIKAENSGFVHSIDALELGLVSVSIGAGRLKSEDKIDPFVGIELFHKVGDPIHEGDNLCKLYLNTIEDKSELVDRVKNAFHISNKMIKPKVLIHCMITEKGESPVEEILKAL